MEINFTKILVAFDSSPSADIALEKAIDAAERFDAEVHTIYVLNGKEDKTQEIRTKIEEVEKKRGRSIQLHTSSGRVYKEINTLEREIGADLIIMGTHGTQGWQPFWIGSNAFRTVSASNCPVITIQETTKKIDLQDILLPLADSIETRQKIPYAAIMAKAFDARVHVFAVSKDDDNETKNRINAYAHQAVKILQEQGIETTNHMELGVNVPEACMKYAKETRSGMIMIMTETESGGFFMGTYAQQLINQSKVPVMSIHSRDLRVAGSVGY